MAAAALRLGGRTLLRRTQQLSDQRRRLFFSNTKLHAATPEEKKLLAFRQAEIDGKQEELYDMVFGLVSKYDLHLRDGRRYRLLLERLSVNVEPRPYDLYWRQRRRMELAKRFVLFVGAHTLCFSAVQGVYQVSKEVRVKRRNWVDDWDEWWHGNKTLSHHLNDWWNGR
ncbi:uncharacterized protein LOC119357201 [Triticum dicoccoides]|uniref:uncharacterized protein LOC119357201 n=1 Tax=Triticum dicoccoides TaxID=85692 RepID=UPI00188F9F5A|nr:uncharacterized protein LOC119357201 [Triticum dicoccoides]